MQCLSVHNNFHTSGKKMRKKICILLVATFLEDRRIISYYKYFCGKNGGRGIFFWKHWEGRLTWKGKFTYTYTLLIIQCLCNNYSSTQKINETKVNNLRNKTHTCFLIPMMKGYGLKVKHQVNSRVSLIKKGKVRK